MRPVLLALFLVLFWVSGAEGQSRDRWLILPTTADPDDAWVGPTAERLRMELGAGAWQLEEAARQFEAVGSAAAATVDEEEIQRWIADSNNAVRDLAEGDYASALDHLTKAHALSRRATEELNREHQRAQRMLDTCLYSVRALLETGGRSRARTRAEECRQLVPRVEPTAYMHPPTVLEVLAEAEDSRASRPRLLEVTSEPAGCGVRVNGVMLGETPLEVRDLVPGEYGVQVECEPGQSGRIHVVDLSTASTNVFVDTRFDLAVSTRPVLHLRYDSAEAEATHRMVDAAQVARAVPGRWIVLASKPERGVLTLELSSGEPLRPSAVARIPAGREAPSSADASLAIRTLVDGQCTDFTSGEPVPLPCPHRVADAAPVADIDWPARRTPRGQFVAGVTLAAIGSAALVTGWILLAPQASAANDWLARIDAGAIETPIEQEKWINVHNAILITSSVGAATLVAAMPLALPKSSKTPWPAWLAGGVGVGALAFAIAYGATGEAAPNSCRSGANTNDRPGAEACITHAERVSVAVLAGTTAAPLLTTPLVYLLRRSDKKLEPQIKASRHGGYLGLRGAF